LYITTDGPGGDIVANGGTDGIFGIFNTTNSGTISLNAKNSGETYNDIISLTSSTALINGDLNVTGIVTATTALINGDLNVTGIVTATTKFVGNGTIPVGGIIMWSGSVASIPSGWALCNGSNGTPNLQDRFVVAAGSGYNVGATGGSANATLVSHSHTATSTVTDPGHSHGMTIEYDQSTGGGSPKPLPNGTRYATTGANWVNSNTTGVTVATTISTEGSSATNANLPPYYALAFIMRTV
jgi:microcystin-dependent protein